MKRTSTWWVWIVAIVLIGAGYYVGRYVLWPATPAPQAEAPAPPPPPIAKPEPPKEEGPPPIQFPIEKAEGPADPLKSVPDLDQSDTTVLDLIAGVMGNRRLQQYAQVDGIIRRIVATIDNLPREKAPPHLWPVKRTAGAFVVAGKEADRHIGAGNAARYGPFIQLIESIDAKKLVGAYVRLYPLFQQAYRDLGYPNAYFNDRVVTVIDHLLAAPTLQEPVRLVQPKVFFLYADPALESSSSGQKLLIRMGTDNANRIKVKLREVRSALTGIK